MKFHALYEKAVRNVLGKIYIPASNMNIGRRDMPQILAKNLDDYMEWLRSEGIIVNLATMNGAELTPSQLDINDNKVRSLIVNQPPKLNAPIIVSNDKFVIDGHHRWLAKLNMSIDRNNVPIYAFYVDLSAHELIRKTRLYPYAFYKSVDNKIYKQAEHGLPL